MGVVKLRVGGFQRAQLPEQAVELGVGHDRAGVGVVRAVGTLEEFAQLDDPLMFSRFAGLHHAMLPRPNDPVHHPSSPVYHARMSATIIDGARLAKKYREDIKARVAAVKSRGGTVRLDAVLA